MDQHDALVHQIQSRIHRFYKAKKPWRVYHGGTNSTRQSQYTYNNIIDTSSLDRVLKIDAARKTVLVEPNVPMDALVSAVLPFHLVPPVVMEFPGITCGGGFAGTSGESSSFRYGFFDRTVNWVEIVLANGEVVRASRDERADLFQGAAASLGTLGLVTMLELRLVVARPYVELMYVPFTCMEEGIARIQGLTRDESVDYVDGILYSATKGVLCVGRTVDEPKYPVQRFMGRRDPWFYLHVWKLLDASASRSVAEPVIECIPLVDYLFRYDRGGFWVARYAFRYFLMPFNRITRYILDYFMHTRVMYHALHRSSQASKYIIQDVAIPYTSATNFVTYLDKEFTHYPIWLCPLKLTGQDEDSARGLLASMPRRAEENGKGNDASGGSDGQEKEVAPLEYMLNFGVWGPGPTQRRAFIDWNRAFERVVRELGGQKWLYAQAYYTESEFYSIYDRTDYEQLRTKYHASHLPSVYDKVKVDYEAEQRRMRDSWWVWICGMFWGIWPLAGLYGVWKAFWGGDYLLPKGDRETAKIMRSD